MSISEDMLFQVAFVLDSRLLFDSRVIELNGRIYSAQSNSEWYRDTIGLEVLREFLQCYKGGRTHYLGHWQPAVV